MEDPTKVLAEEARVAVAAAAPAAVAEAPDPIWILTLVGPNSRIAGPAKTDLSEVEGPEVKKT